jgi:putative proteasome-type protease
MTFCLGMMCADGLVAIADTRITSGTEVSTAKKIAVHQDGDHAMFVLTSGLRSVRDKAITYFEERLRSDESHLTRLHQAANLLADELRRVYNEDQYWLAQAGLIFDLHLLLGGQMAEDADPHLYLIYPQGNWIEVTQGTPYLIIGETRYGKPILDRAWRYEDTLEKALRVGLLALDATRTSAADVGPPVDVVLYRTGSRQMAEHRFSADELRGLSDYWANAINAAVELAVPAVIPLALALGADPAPLPDPALLRGNGGADWSKAYTPPPA